MANTNVIISNAFSLQMIKEFPAVPIVEELDINEVRELLKGEFTSAVGHADTANVLTNIIGVTIPNNRISICLERKDTLIVAQVMGGRLPEGSTTLPENFSLKFLKVNLINPCTREKGNGLKTVCDGVTSCHPNCNGF